MQNLSTITFSTANGSVYTASWIPGSAAAHVVGVVGTLMGTGVVVDVASIMATVHVGGRPALTWLGEVILRTSQVTAVHYANLEGKQADPVVVLVRL